MDLLKLKEQLTKHEGLELKPYRDPMGNWTIGVGRNLDTNGISKAEALAMLDNDVFSTIRDLTSQPFWFRIKDDDVRCRALVDMCFNLGLPGLLEFKKMIGFLNKGDWEGVAWEMKHSKWYVQVGQRGDDLVSMMRDGIDPVPPSS